MKTNLLLVACVFCFSLQSFGQQTPNVTNKKEHVSLSSFDKNQEDTITKIKKNAFSISFGSSGIGVGYARKLNSKFSAMLTYSTFEIKDKEVDISSFLDNDDVAFSGGGKSTIIDLGAEYLPFKNSSFKLAFGVGFLNDVNINGTITYKEGIKFGDVNITPQDVGKVVIDSKWSGVAPFIGFGFGRAVPKNRFGFGIDIGTYFAKSPQVDLQADKLLAPTQDEEATLQEAFKSLTFIPRIQFRLTYKF
ncbi:hypothetical protein [Polaribacter uvawellassae]|uniref:hypothetical protein n=1 Tax=Polaribacter uvawellassae TaxID=3133495 RepID=UPI003219EF30